MKKYLIVNADDFGRTDDINRGIAKSFEHGIVSSVSLMVNFAAFDNAVELSKKFNIPVGLHFNLTDGRPVSPPSHVPSLLNSNGQFFKKMDFYRRVLTGRFRAQELCTELKAQWQKCADIGILPDHYDGHHHIHAIKGVAQIVRTLNKNIEKLPFRRISLPHYRQSWSAKAQQIAIHLFEDKRPTINEFPTTFWGFDFMDRSDKKGELAKIITHIKPGVHEMMCHPGFESAEDIGYYNAQREREIEALCDENMKTQLTDLNIKLLSYQDISGVAG